MTRHPGGCPSGPTPTQHERCHPLADGSDGVRQRRRRPRPPAPRLGNQDRSANRLALLRGPQQPHHDVERPARAPRGPQGKRDPSCTLASTSPHPHPTPPRPDGERRDRASGIGVAGWTGPGCGDARSRVPAGHSPPAPVSQRSVKATGNVQTPKWTPALRSRPAASQEPPPQARPWPASGRGGGPGEDCPLWAASGFRRSGGKCDPPRGARSGPPAGFEGPWARRRGAIGLVSLGGPGQAPPRPPPGFQG